ncbi:prolipoprotein diacylglyceryl transferase [Pseudahrensia aquimaris]|uniref:Phosphatidylglycerol--prolipoprotein diacylglyceryl transferase n=1 Tax=Pseudahrensia aquimaris TaxID=744461 RepID=A0ABW3FD27_9HYPH
MPPLEINQLAIVFPAIDPVALQIGPLSVHWYGIGYVVSILLGWWFARLLVSTPRLWPEGGAPFGKEDLDDFLTWAVIGIIAGGRLGYVLFYNLGYYLSNPLQIPAVWDGGMSFHGGALGTIVAMMLFARSRGFTAFSLLDVIATASCFGMFLVRIANFINSELWGRTTDVAWGVIFPNGGPEPRHPSQLYESFLEGAVLFAVLNLLIWKYGKLKSPGFIGGAWVLGYGVARIIVEFFRQPDAHLGYLAGDWLTMGMVLSIPMLLIGVWGMATASQRSVWRTQRPETS